MFFLLKKYLFKSILRGHFEQNESYDNNPIPLKANRAYFEKAFKKKFSLKFCKNFNMKLDQKE